MGPANEKFLSGQYFESGILFIYSGQLSTGGERNTGCGGEPFNLNFLNFLFVGPINSYLDYNPLVEFYILEICRIQSLSDNFQLGG